MRRDETRRGISITSVGKLAGVMCGMGVCQCLIVCVCICVSVCVCVWHLLINKPRLASSFFCQETFIFNELNFWP